MDFDIPIGKNGDCYDRYACASKKCASRLKIVRQCVRKTAGPEGKGRWSVTDKKIVPPKRAEMKRSWRR